MKKNNYHDGELSELSGRTANGLYAQGIDTRDKFVTAVIERTNAGRGLMGAWPGMGCKSLIEALEWAGLPVPLSLKKIRAYAEPLLRVHQITCPHCRKTIAMGISKPETP